MEQWEVFINKLVELVGFKDYRIDIKADERKCSIFIYEDQYLLRENLPAIVEAMNHLIQMAARKQGSEAIFLDINNYRQERENLIGELARAAAKKASATKTEISLPAMNSYERRLVHMALAIHPDVKTESVGDGKERYVIIKPIETGN
jgi:spoIIIJ-associated protein